MFVGSRSHLQLWKEATGNRLRMDAQSKKSFHFIDPKKRAKAAAASVPPTKSPIKTNKNLLTRAPNSPEILSRKNSKTCAIYNVYVSLVQSRVSWEVIVGFLLVHQQNQRVLAKFLRLMLMLVLGQAQAQGELGGLAEDRTMTISTWQGECTISGSYIVDSSSRPGRKEC